MMQGRLYIDGRDAYADFGVYLKDGALGAFAQHAALKTPDSTDWADEDGEEYDLTAPLLDKRTLSLSFFAERKDWAEDFFAFLAEGGAYRDFRVPALQRTWRLRLTQGGSFASCQRLGEFTLTFADDFPDEPAGEPLAFGQSGVRQSGHELDDTDLSQYGAWLLSGSVDTLRKAAQVKTALEVTTKDRAGAVYDGDGEPRFKSKEVTLNLLIKTATAEEFWARYDALFAALLKPEPRRVYFAETERVYEGFYTKEKVSGLRVGEDGAVWCETAVTMKLVSCRPCGTFRVLASEDWDFITTEDGAKLLIRPLAGVSAVVAESGEYVTAEDGETTIYINNPIKRN